MSAKVQTASILLIEDTADDERLALRALRMAPIAVHVEVLRDGEQAIEYLVGDANRHRPPDLVLLDLKLPKVNGLEVLRAVRESPHIALLPVVVLTSSDERRDVAECYRLHANAYVRKAVDYSEYMENMKKLLEFWLSVNITPTLEREPVS
jgi:CheY-like chemotaxis protein